MRTTFIQTGFERLNEYTILELLLFYSIPRENTNPLAHRLIDEFGTLSSVLDAPYEKLIEVKGVSESTAVLIKMVSQIGEVYVKDKEKYNHIYDTVEAFGNVYKSKYFGKRNEQLNLVTMDRKYRIIGTTLIAEGTVSRVDFYQRKIVEKAIMDNAQYVVLVHNHISGVALPSDDDIKATHDLEAALEKLDIILLDHMVMANNDFVSMRQDGKIKGTERFK